MPDQPAVNQLPPNPHPKLARFRAKLGRSGLLGILDSLPTAASLQYFDITFHKKPAIKICLGRRQQDNGEFATSWAFLELEKSDDPIVHFRDEGHPTGDAIKSTFYKRSASALVRKAQDLLPPFRFMQRDTYDDVKNLRGMLTALVLYYALMYGVSDAALGWKNFHNSLTQALEYIEKEAAYHLWTEKATEPTQSKENTAATTPAVSPPKATRHHRGSGNEPHHVGPSRELQGGSVSSRGSSMSPPAGSCLANFMKVLGKDLPLLDLLPSTPVAIERQTVCPGQFPFRLLFGKCNGVDVHIYPNLAGSRETKITSESQERAWSYANLKGVELLEPFTWLVRLLPDSDSRGNKMRFLVAYYFWLAEAEGLIDPPTFNFALETMRPFFVALCKMFQQAVSQQTGISPKRSLIVRLRPVVEVLSILSEGAPMCNGPDTALPVAPPHPEMTQTPQSVRALSGDSGIQSKYTTPASTVDGTNVLLRDLDVEKPAEHESGNVPGPQTITPNEREVDAMVLENDADPVPSIEEPGEPLPPLQEAQSSVGERQAARVQPDEMLIEEAFVEGMAQNAMDVDDLPVPSIEEPDPPQSSAQETESAAIDLPPAQDLPIKMADHESGIHIAASDPSDRRNQPTPRIDEPNLASPPPELRLDLIESTPEVDLEALRQPSAFSISSEDDEDQIASRRLDRPVPQLNLQDESPWRKDRLIDSEDVIDFTKDDDDGMAFTSRSRQEERAEALDSPQPRSLPTSRTPWRQSIIISSDDDDDDGMDLRAASRRQNASATVNAKRPQPRAMPSSRMQWRQTINISDDDDHDKNLDADDDDDDLMEDVEGDAWRRASLRQRPGL